MAKERIHLYVEISKVSYLRVQSQETGFTISQLVEQLIEKKIAEENPNWLDNVSLGEISVGEFINRLKKLQVKDQ